MEPDTADWMCTVDNRRATLLYGTRSGGEAGLTSRFTMTKVNMLLFLMSRPMPEAMYSHV